MLILFYLDIKLISWLFFNFCSKVVVGKLEPRFLLIFYKELTPLSRVVKKLEFQLSHLKFHFISYLHKDQEINLHF